MFIDVKKEHFQVFIENENKFVDEKIKILNKEALEYYKMLEKKEKINFRNWCLFFKLYKYENFSYMIQNFAILNLPIIAKILFKLKK